MKNLKPPLFFIFLFFSILSCNSSNNVLLLDREATGIDGKNYSASGEKKVLVFYAPECPLSENYTLVVNNLFNEYGNNNIKFFGIIPGQNYTIERVKTFRNRYKVKFPLITDPEFELVRFLDASITPEAFVLDERNRILYSGAIDNWAISLGKKRKSATENYLKVAIDAILAGENVKIGSTSAVGCIIE